MYFWLPCNITNDYLLPECLYLKNSLFFWDGRNEADEDVASGLYMYRPNAKNFTEIKKMMLIR